jgi:predicted ArsR family transcriptional regulator
MSRTHTLRKLLRHGPLRLSEIVAITGWSYNVARHTLAQLRSAGLVVARNLVGYPYHHELRDPA